MSELYNNKINVLKALAILLVVSGHLEFSLIPMFPPYSFQVVLFFFIAGMLFKKDYSFPVFIKKRLKSLLIPYFIYEFLYLIITIAIAPICGKYWGMSINLKNIFLMPFLTGHQLDLISPLWFVPCLFITLMIYKLFSCLKISDNLKLIICFILSLSAIQMQNYAENIYVLWILRSAFALLFVHLGYMYKHIWENKYNLFTSKIFYALLVLQSILWLTNKDFTPQDGVGLHYLLVWGTYNNWIVPILTSIAGIWISLFIVNICYDYIKDWKFIQQIGQNSYHIMANHLLIFNLITYSILAIKGIPFDVKNSQDIYWFYRPIITTYFYFIFGVIITTYIGVLIKFIKSKSLFKNF